MTTDNTSENNSEQQRQELAKLLLASLQQSSKANQRRSDEVKAKFSLKDLKNLDFKLLAKNLLNSTLKVMQRIVYYVDRFIAFVSQPEDPNRNELMQYIRKTTLVGGSIILIFVVGGGLWAGLAPLDSATVAIGTVISSSNKKIVQHMEGGIVKEVYVKQGDHVVEQQPLLALEDRKSKTYYEIALNEYRDALANEGRLLAERDLEPEPAFDAFLMNDINDPVVAKIITNQRNLFKSRRAASENIITNQYKKINQYNKQIEGLIAKKATLDKQREIVAQKIKDLKPLVTQGFVQNSALSDQISRLEQLKGEIAMTSADIAKAQEEISKTEIDITNHRTQWLADNLKDLREAQNAVAKSRENYYTQKDALERIIIRSPVEGIVNELSPSVYTKGAVLGSGQVVAEISPLRDQLIIEAKIEPKDIASVAVGQPAKVRFSAFKSRRSPIFHGTVVFLSPDTIVDKTGQMRMMNKGDNYYAAKIEIDLEEFEKLAKKYKFQLHPGLQAEVQIIKGTRTLLRYLLDPLFDQMFHAFIEK